MILLKNKFSQLSINQKKKVGKHLPRSTKYDLLSKSVWDIKLKDFLILANEIGVNIYDLSAQATPQEQQMIKKFLSKKQTTTKKEKPSSKS